MLHYVTVETAESHNCHGVGKLALPLPSGFILGPPAAVSGLQPGSPSTTGCTRVVAASEGQRINLTLYDFGLYTDELRSRERESVDRRSSRTDERTDRRGAAAFSTINHYLPIDQNGHFAYW
jgi:hypothetical protein